MLQQAAPAATAAEEVSRTMDAAADGHVHISNISGSVSVSGWSRNEVEVTGEIGPKVEELIFGERTKIVIDSSEERIKTEFDGVKRTFIPLHAVLRIDEVEKAGRGRITPGAGKVATFPMAMVGPGKPAADEPPWTTTRSAPSSFSARKKVVSMLTFGPPRVPAKKRWMTSSLGMR